MKPGTTNKWLLTIRTGDKISTSPMLCDVPISYDDAMAVAVSQFGADRVISVIGKTYQPSKPE